MLGQTNTTPPTFSLNTTNVEQMNLKIFSLLNTVTLPPVGNLLSNAASQTVNDIYVEKPVFLTSSDALLMTFNDKVQFALISRYPARPFSMTAKFKAEAIKAYLMNGDMNLIYSFNQKYKLVR